MPTLPTPVYNIVSSWQTSTAGAIVATMFVIALLWAPPQYKDKIQSTAVAISTVMLAISKDYNK